MFLTDKKGIPGVVFGSEYLGAKEKFLQLNQNLATLKLEFQIK